jgi:hypothetical protein
MKKFFTLLVVIVFLSNSSYAIGPITGTVHVCQGDSTLLSDTSAGGVWTSGNTTIARVDSVSGMVRGRRPGTATISYTIGGSSATAVVTVNPAPNAGRITGPTGLCLGDTMRVAETVTGGTWYITNGHATISAGLVTSVSLGRDTILYTISNSCGSDTATRAISIGTPPAAITNAPRMCQGDTVSLSDPDAGGTWRSGNFGVAVVIPTTNIMIGVAAGTASISYTVNGCSATLVFTVNPLPAAHAITGGGHYCPAAGGADIRLNGSNNGIIYYLLYAATFPVDSLFGTGTPLDFGLQGIPGGYTVMAMNPLTGCHRNMTGNDTVVQDTAFIPVVHITATPGVSIAAGQSVTLHATAANAGAHPSYQWVVGGTYIGGATSSSFTSNAFADNDSVTCYITSYGTCGSYTSLEHIIMHVHPAGVPQVAASDAFGIFPNPNNGSFTLSLLSAASKEATVIITNIMGEKVAEFPLTANRPVPISLNVRPGLYFVTAITANGRYAGKLVIE